MGWGCYRHEWDRGSPAWKNKVAEITPEDCVPWGRDEEVCPACHEEVLIENEKLRKSLANFITEQEIVEALSPPETSTLSNLLS